jgi:hypothetical protein
MKLSMVMIIICIMVITNINVIIYVFVDSTVVVHDRITYLMITNIYFHN